MKNDRLSTKIPFYAGLEAKLGHRRKRTQLLILVIALSLLFLNGCKNNPTPTPEAKQTDLSETSMMTDGTPQTSSTETEVGPAESSLERTPTGIETLLPTETPTATETPVPTETTLPTETPTPHLTITPNAPGIISEVAYAQPPRPGGFSRPAANVPSTLEIINQTSIPLRITLEGVGDAALVNAGGSTEWQVVPGTYTYSIVAEAGGLAFLQETVTVGPGEIVTIIIDELAVSELVFINQTNLSLSINIPDANKTINLTGGQTSASIPLPPGTYEFTASALSSAPYQSSATLEAGEITEITLIASDVTGNSSVTLNNQTNFPLRLTVGNIGASITAGAGNRSERLYLPPGTYNYTACDSASGSICVDGDFTIQSGVNIEVVIDDIGGASAVRFENQTSYTIVIRINGVTNGVTIPPGTTSAPIDILPGTYTYNATSENIAPFSNSFTVAADEELVITLFLSADDYAVLTIINSTDCTLTMNLTGPNTFSFTVLPNTTKEVNILNGTYTYSATACNASTSGSFSGSHEIEFYFQ